MKANDKGFSLIELILVIAIMAVLTAMIAPNLTKYLGKSKEQTDKKNLQEMKHQILSCISQASVEEIDVIDGEDGIRTAEYELTYDATQKKVVASTGTNGVSRFAGLLNDVFDTERIGSAVDKKKDKVLIEISGTVSGGYVVKVSYTS